MRDFNLHLVLPHVILAIAAVAVMITSAFYRRQGHAIVITSAGLIASFIALWKSVPYIPEYVTGLLCIDFIAVYFLGIFIAGGFFAALFSFDYLETNNENQAEYFILLLLMILGAGILAGANHFASFFLGLEILSVSLYALIAYRKTPGGIEAGIKYLILASVSSSFLLFGAALIYAETGVLTFSELASVGAFKQGSVLVETGAMLTLVGIGFKLGVVPFHMWTPDVYAGAPAPVTSLLATVSKGAVFAVLLRYLGQAPFESSLPIHMIIGMIAVFSMFTGNLLALFQDNVKRILAYSSIAHLGYLLVAFLASGGVGVSAAAFYFAAYFVTLLGAFGIITLISGEREADQIEDYAGLFRERPWTAGAFTLMLLSLAGIPLTAGFIGKFYIFAAGAFSSLWILITIMAINSAIGLFYYLRIISVMFVGVAQGEQKNLPLPLGGAVVAVLTGLLLWLGIYPEPVLQLIRLSFGVH
jgi:NADH-quinone oxidoreductase subunit N